MRGRLQQAPSPTFLWAYLAWALTQREADEEGLQYAVRAVQDAEALTPFEGMLLERARGQALMRLGRKGWLDAYERALRWCRGRTRGITLMEFGSLLARAGEQARAVQVFSEARLALKGEELEGWALNSLGLMALQLGHLEDAERYFREMFRVGGKFRSRALSGQGAAYRALGEWKRAEDAYTQAATQARKAGDEDDLRQALRGLGHTLRLQGRMLAALEPLTEAARAVQADRDAGTSWVNVDLAAAHVSLPHLDAAQVEGLLGRSGVLGREDADRAQIVRAELARRTGDAARALDLMQGQEQHLLWVREESLAFPALFALLPLEAQPQPLPRPPVTRLEVRAAGFPEVRVNGRILHLPPLSLVALVALLEGEGQVSGDALLEALDDGQVREARQARQRASKVMNTLRQGLGWKGSIVTRGGFYELGPGTKWTYDVRELRRAGRPVEAFLSGVPLPWVTAQEQELRQADSNPLSLVGG